MYVNIEVHKIIIFFPKNEYLCTVKRNKTI